APVGSVTVPVMEAVSCPKTAIERDRRTPNHIMRDFIATSANVIANGPRIRWPSPTSAFLFNIYALPASRFDADTQTGNPASHHLSKQWKNAFIAFIERPVLRFRHFSMKCF